MRYFLIILTLLTLATPALAKRPALAFRSGFDFFQLDQSAIEGINGLSIFYTTDQGYYFGESIYSAAFGAGGGFFVGGFEVGKHTPFGENLFWDASLFIGGGGGANQVPGDGLMLRPQVHLGYDFGNLRVGAGASWVSISGSEISTPAFTITLTRPMNLALYGGDFSGVKPLENITTISAMKPIMRVYYPQGSRKRGGVILQNMQLLGAEISFARTDASESFIQANGVVRGDAEGYADWLLGKRYFWGGDTFRLYADFAAGVGGGGAVNTGGGLIFSAGAGLRIKTGDRFALEFGASALTSLNGDFLALSPSAGFLLSFGAGRKTGAIPNTTHWQISTGLTQQLPNAGFRKSGVVNTGAPLMIDTEIDLFITRNLYLTGHAYTAIAGGAGGYQIGLLGLGYRIRLAPRWNISAEGLLGAGGGAGVDTRGGLLAGIKFDLDYLLTETIHISAGAGFISTLQGGGMQPVTLNLGLKFPFTTLH